jgi:hypothetical protein
MSDSAQSHTRNVLLKLLETNGNSQRQKTPVSKTHHREANGAVIDGKVPVSWVLLRSLLLQVIHVQNQQSAGQTTANNTNASPSSPRSNSQFLKRRQLAHGARNRAGQLIVGQAPATPRTNRALVRQPQTTQTHHRRRLVPTHSRVSAVSWPTVLGIVPVS